MYLYNDTMEAPRLEGVFHVSETGEEVTTLWAELLSWRVQARY